MNNPTDKKGITFSQKANEIDLHPLGMTRAKTLVKILPFGLTTLWAWSKSGAFPAPVKVGENITAWRNQDILNWLNKQTPAISATDKAEV